MDTLVSACVHRFRNDSTTSDVARCPVLGYQGIDDFLGRQDDVLRQKNRTEAIALQNDGRTHYFGLDPTQKVESLVINFEQFLSKFVYTSVSNVSCSVKDLEKNVETAFAQIPELLHQYRDQYRKILTPPTIEPLPD